LSAVLLHHVDGVTFEQAPPRSLNSEDFETVERFWASQAALNPHLFDGQLVEVRDLEWRGRGCHIRWSVNRYALSLWRRAFPPDSDDAPFARAVFAAVAVEAPDGSLVVGRMGSHTSTEGRIQCPGGQIEPPDDGEITLDYIRSEAARELVEETGVIVDLNGAPIWTVKTGGKYGDVGIYFKAKASNIEETFDRHCRTLDAAGELPEFGSLIFVNAEPAAAAAEPPDILRPHLDHLQPLLFEMFGDTAVSAREYYPR
jgi:8-oxo-dGTP pyrophosphatase MutT (NUDIX family)